MIRIIYQICIFFLLATDVACVDRSQQPQVAEAKSSAAPNHNSGVQLLLSPTDDRVASGEPVVLHAILANGGDKTIKIFETTPERDIWLTVEDDSHAPVPLTRLGLRYETRKNWINIRREVIPVDPGAKREYKIFANRFYDMTL